MVSSSSATVPHQRSREAKASGSVVKKLIHQAGRGMALTTVPGVRAGGIDMPFRLSRRRAPATGTSTVTSSVSKPGCGGAVDEGHRALPVLPHVELEPVAAVRVRGLHVLDRRGAHRRQRERDARRAGRGGARALALGLHHAGEPGRRDAERQGDGRRRAPRGTCRRGRRRAGSTGGTRCPRTPDARGPARSRPRRRPRCSRRRPSACGASRWSRRSAMVSAFRAGASWRSARAS